MGLWLNCLLCMLLGLSLTHLIKAQINTEDTEVEGAGGGAAEGDQLKVGDPVFYNFDVIMAKKHMVDIRPGGRLQLDCKVTPPGTFKAWIKDGIVVGTEPSLTIKTDDLSAFGVYHCAADPAVSQDLYKALEFAITNMPPADKTTELSVGLNRDIALTCKLNTPNNLYKWYKYNDMTFRFEEMTGQTGRQLQLPYNEMNRNRGAGFTFYKCADPSDENAFQAFKISKEPTRTPINGQITNTYAHGMRQIPSDVASIPLSITPKSKVTFECHKVNPSDNTKWFFRDNNTISPATYNELGASNPGAEIQETSESSLLSVKDCDVKNKGYYRCNVGGVVKYAFLDIRVIVPTIHEYGKATYDLSKNTGADNELECEIPIGGELNDVIWRIIPPNNLGLATYDIPVNTKREEFETSIKDSVSSQMVTIKFGNNPRLHNYRLECRLGDELDHVLLQYEQSPGISIINGGRKGILIILNCTHDDRLTEIKFHSNADRTEPTGAPLRIHASPSPTLKLYYQKADKKQMWFRCSGLDRSTGNRIYSEPVPLLKDPLLLDIKVDNAPNPKGAEPSITKLEGLRTEFLCNFSNYKDLNIRAENVKLVREGSVLSNLPQSVGPAAFKFTFENPQASSSGKYYCLHSVNIPDQNVRSMEIRLNWCAANQFMCDNRCRDKDILCNGVRECADGSDESPAQCSPCEPNEVPCKDWKGLRPGRNCVLKHWLCDGADDCENGYDEESPVSKEWCTNTCVSKSWLNCPYNSTCCNSMDKCILRAYECDSETDCGSGEDENNCCSLTITDPSSRRTINQREGSRLTLTCRALGSERPTINWRCNWGKLRDDTRMKESNTVIRRNPDNTYEVEGTLVIENFNRNDECLYNCEAVTKCQRQLSHEFDVKVGEGPDCNRTCGIGGACKNEVCVCKANVEGANCERCKAGYHSMNKDHPDGCVQCFCSDRSNLCENAGLYFKELKIANIEPLAVRLTGWGLYGVYEEATSREKITVGTGPEIVVSPTGDSALVVKDDDESYAFLTSWAGKRLSSYAGKISFTVQATVPMGAPLTSDTSFPLFGIKGWRGQTLVYWDHKTYRAPDTRYSVTLDEQNMRAIDGSRVTRNDVMTVLADVRGIFFRVYHFTNQMGVRIANIRYEEATEPTGTNPAPVERCTTCPDPYQGALCEDCKNSSDFHKIIDYNSTINRWKCVPCKKGYQNPAECNVCEEGYADNILGRPNTEKPDCKEFVVPSVEPETLNIPSGRTVVLTCRIRRQKQGYNGTAWLLEWQDGQGRRLAESPRMFQVRNEATTRLIIKDVNLADTGRYRCEGYNRRSGYAYAFTNLTVESRSVKRVTLKMETNDSDTTTLKCALIRMEPFLKNQFRATLTRTPFVTGRQSEMFEQVKQQVNGKNFTGSATYGMSNSDDSGYWACHITDTFSNYTVTRRIPVVLKPRQTFNWELNTPEPKVEKPVGSAVRLKCNKVIRSSNQITIPISWSFKPAIARFSSSFAHPLGAALQKVRSIMDETNEDILPPGVSRDGDELVLNPLSMEHWGTFSCTRRYDSDNRKSAEGSRRAPGSGRSRNSEETSEDLKKATIEVIPTLAGRMNFNLEDSDNITLPCMPMSDNLDEDGLPCHKYSWAYKSISSAKQLLDAKSELKMLPLFGETKPVFKIIGAKPKNAGSYYCRCHTFFRSDREAQFSKVMEYNIGVSALEDKPPRAKYLMKESTFVDKKLQWLYCYDDEGQPPAETWWDVFDELATKIPGITLAGNGIQGKVSFSNITFIMDKYVHQSYFTCNAKNDVDHSRKILNMRYNSDEYDPLRLKIIVKTRYDMFHKLQNDSLAVEDKIYFSMDQFGKDAQGYRDSLIILCHMIGSPSGTDLELIHDDPMSPSDDPNPITRCRNIKWLHPNLVMCNVTSSWNDVREKWSCRAKQRNPATNVVKQYVKNLSFGRVPSKIKIRMQYNRKLYGYDDLSLKFYLERGAIAVIRCDASYYENGRLSEIPFPVVYEFFIIGQEGLPNYFKVEGNILRINDIPETLHEKEVVCFVRPQNKSDIATLGIGQRYFSVVVFKIPEKPSILMTMRDSNDSSLMIRNPELVELVRNGPVIELTCTLLNFDRELDQTEYNSNKRYLDWVKCKNYNCNYHEADYGTDTSVSNMKKRLEGDKAIIQVQTNKIDNTGFFMCVAVRPYINESGNDDLQSMFIPVKLFMLIKPGESDGAQFTYGSLIIGNKTGDIEFDCRIVGFPFPNLKINRYESDNKEVGLETPKWIRDIDREYFDDLSHLYGSRLKYRLPKENIENDKARGTYVCTAESKLGKAEVEENWNPK